MKKQEIDQSFCLTAVSFIFTFLSLGANISILVLQITNNQMSLFSQVNINYVLGDLAVTTSCSSVATYTPLKYYCIKYQNHIAFLQITNVMLIGIIFILLLVGAFLTVFIVNLKRKSHKCISQESNKKIVLGLLSLEMIMAICILGYYVSFYLQFDYLTLVDTNVSDYRSTFFIGLVVACAGGVFVLANYIIIFIVKAQKNLQNKYKPTNPNQNTLNTTVGNQKTQRQGNTNMPRKQPLPSKMKQRERFYNNKQEQNKVQKNKPEVNIDEVVAEQQQVGTDFKSNEKRTTRGIIRQRPKLPTKTQMRTQSYPRLQKPFFYSGKKNKKSNPDDLQLIKEVKDDLINKPNQNGQMQVYESILAENIDQEGNIDKQNSMIQGNSQVNTPKNKGGKQKEVQMVNFRLNTNFGSQGEVSNMDPTRLFVFERKLGFTEDLKIKQRKQRYKPI